MKQYLIFIPMFFLLSNFLFAQKVSTRISVRDDRGEYSYKSSDTFSSYEIKYKGKITITDDEKGIASISPGGYFKVSKTTFGNKRAVAIESNSNGQLNYEYFSGKSREDFNEEGKSWLADIMLDVLRKTGLGADIRVKRLYNSGGIDKVLNEISEIESSSVQGLYFENLLELKNLKKGEPGLIAKKIGYVISSSSEKGRIFRKYASKFLQDESSADAYFEGVSRITSSSEKGSVLRSVLKNNKLSVAALTKLLETAEEISSSSETGSVLRTVNEVFVNNEAFIEAYFNTVDHITSSSERGSVLRSLMQKNTINARAMERLLKSSSKISSSSEQGSILRAAVEKGLHNDQKVQTQFFDALDRISSTSEKGSVLRSLLSETTLTNESMVMVFKGIRSISSSSEKGATLRKSFHLVGKSTIADQEFFKAVESIDSSSEKGNVLSSLTDENNLSESVILQILKASETISSSSEKGHVLVSVSKVMDKSNTKLKDAYKEAARTISSDSEYRRVMEEMY
ncbi:hypothetical protein [Chondrinema litorale]|uniref:hypothetical protein n=1 Tax=Chondrinema litorale TaxID=2994555 RepID=UPI002542FABE|nr:hypothetical protein [Chondrinema litorale]UZR92361.1 hypothetical protein OQ292_10865 [Chondrinema litorale]